MTNPQTEQHVAAVSTPPAEPPVIRVARPVIRCFEPKDDMTTCELALILRAFGRVTPEMMGYEHEWMGLGPALRHFSEPTGEYRVL